MGDMGRPDAVVREISRLLGVVAAEERALVRLDQVVAELHAVAAARAALADCTRAELVEAATWPGPDATRPAAMLPVAPGVGR